MNALSSGKTQVEFLKYLVLQIFEIQNEIDLFQYY